MDYFTMLRRYNKFKGFRSIELTDHQYLINIDGEVRTRNNEIVPVSKIDENGEWLKLECLDGEIREINRAVLVSMVSRETKWLPWVYPYLTMYFLDGNPLNVHPQNTIWKPLPKNIKLGNIRLIPGFSRYGITADGILYNLKSGIVKKWYRDKDGYFVSHVVPDVGQPLSSGRRHRLLMLAWSDYPIDVCRLDVNHLNTNPGDDWLDNLEWATRSQNNLHSVSHGNMFSIGVKSKCIFTGEEKLFPSIRQAADYYRMKDSILAKRCDWDGMRVFKPGCLFKYQDSTTPWPDLEYAKKHLVSLSAYTVTISDGGVETNYSSVVSAAKALGVQSGTLNWHLNKKDVYEFNGKKIRRRIGRS